MAGCSLVALPLDTEAPAGLIVLFQAAAMERSVLVQHTVSTEAYVTDETGVPVRGDAETWAQAIRTALAAPGEMRRRAVALKQRLKEGCSEEAYAATVSRWLASAPTK